MTAPIQHQSVSSFSPGMSRMFYEFVIHQALEDVNQARIEDAKRREAASAEEGEYREIRPDLVKASDGRYYRQRVGEYLETQDPVLSAIDMQGFDPLFMREYAQVPPEQMMQSLDAALAASVEDYQPGSILAKYEEYGATFQQALTDPDFGRVLVSPYDPRFTGREAFMRNGCKLQCVLTQEVEALMNENVQNQNFFVWMHHGNYRNVSVYDPEPVERRGEITMQRTGRMLDATDRAGLSRLRRFMTQQEWDAAAPHVIAGATHYTLDGKKVIDYNAFMSRAAMDRAEAIMEFISSEGLEYRIEPDTRTGQLQVTLPGRGVNVRLIDVNRPKMDKQGQILRDAAGQMVYSDDERYVGRTYAGGVVLTLGVNTGSEDAPGYVASPEEAVDVLRFGLGQSVERTDGVDRTVGQTYPPIRPGERQSRVYQSAFMSTTDKGSYLVGKPQRGDYRENAQLRIYASKPNARVTMMYSPERAEEYLRQAVDSAREQYLRALDIPTLIEAAALENENEARAESLGLNFRETPPDLHSDPVIQAQQLEYWNVLRGRNVRLLAPGYAVNDWREAVKNDDTVAMEAMSGLFEGKDASEVIAQHAQMMVDYNIGHYEVQDDGKRFNPLQVAEFMVSEYNPWRNRDDMIEALRKSEPAISLDQLRGDDKNIEFLAKRIISFDPSRAVNMLDPDAVDPFTYEMGQVIQQTLSERAADVDSIEIDDQGIVKWKATRRIGQRNNMDTQRYKDRAHIEGEIGQILAPGEFGEVMTKYQPGPNGENYNAMIVPGYKATILPQKPGEHKSVFERTRLRGYKEELRDMIRARVSQDVAIARDVVGSPTALSRSLSSLYSVQYDHDWFETSREAGMDDAQRERILRTQARAVYYGQDVREQGTTKAMIQGDRTGLDMRNDNVHSVPVLTGGKNMTVITDGSNGFFSEKVTGTAAVHGVKRFLRPGVVVDEHGEMHVDPNDTREVPLLDDPDAAFMEFDPHDRQNMTHSNMLHATSEAKDIRVAFANVNGYNMEDSIVMSKAAAERIRVVGKDGVRAAMASDKIADKHGNKGTIGLIVDPDLSPEEQPNEAVAEIAKLFKANPELEVVMSPVSFISRHNAGTYREIAAKERDALFVPQEDGSVEEHAGAIGTMNYIVTPMAADKKTNIYDDEMFREGRGRKASGQMTWQLDAVGAHKLKSFFFGGNVNNFKKVAEFYAACGYTMYADGVVTKESDPTRGVIEDTPLQFNSKGNIDPRATRRAFLDNFNNQGGDMLVPFQLTLASGRELEDSGQVDEFGNALYRLPVLSSRLRNEQNLNDGSVSRHDHTIKYMAIFEQVAQWKYETSRGVTDPEVFAKIQAKAQRTYNSLSGDIIRQHIDGRNNMVKSELMSVPQPNSATAVLRSDPSLDIDTVEVNSEMAKAVDPDGRGWIMIIRDPLLSTGGIRYMKYQVNDDVSGVSLNPAVAKSFEGDYDGDTFGIYGGFPDEVHDEAVDKFSLATNLVNRDTAHVNEQGEMEWDIWLHTDMDALLATQDDPELREHLRRVHESVNVLERERYTRESDIHALLALPGERTEQERQILDKHAQWRKQWDAEMDDILGDINDFYKKAFSGHVADMVISFDSPEAHVKSLERCYLDANGKPYIDPFDETKTTSVKGNKKKLDGYTRQAGIDSDTYEDYGHTMATLKDSMDSERALSITAGFTGTAGAHSQMLHSVLAPYGRADLASAVGYPISQAMVQAKKDPVEADYRARVIDGPLRAVLAGQRATATEITRDDGTVKYEWEVEPAPEGISPNEFVDTLQKMIVDEKGMDTYIGPDRLRELANVLTVEDKYGLSIRVATGKPGAYVHENAQLPEGLHRCAYQGSKAMLDEVATDVHPRSAHGARGIYGDSRSPLISMAPKEVVEAIHRRETDPNYQPEVLHFKDVTPEYNATQAPRMLRGDGYDVSALSLEAELMAAGPIGVEYAPTQEVVSHAVQNGEQQVQQQQSAVAVAEPPATKAVVDANVVSLNIEAAQVHNAPVAEMPVFDEAQEAAWRAGLEQQHNAQAQQIAPQATAPQGVPRIQRAYDVASVPSQQMGAGVSYAQPSSQLGAQAQSSRQVEQQRAQQAQRDQQRDAVEQVDGREEQSQRGRAQRQSARPRAGQQRAGQSRTGQQRTFTPPSYAPPVRDERDGGLDL